MKKIKICASMAIVISFVLASLILFIAGQHERENNAHTRQIMAEHVYDSIYNHIMEPIIVSKSMAYDSFLHDKLINEDSYSEKEIEAIMADYLSTLRKKLGYASTFVVSEKTHRYYTGDGIVKILNPQDTPYDIWYPIFLESGKEYDLDTDRDQANNYFWTIFVNIKITDTNGKILGVCGIGVIMDKLQELFKEFEDEFDIKVNLIDTEGLVQVDTISQNIENAYITEAILDKAGSKGFTYSNRGVNGYRMTRFIDDLDWFLVVQGILAQETFGPNVILLLVLSCLLVIFTFYFVVYIISKNEKQAEIGDPLEDKTTGLPNRNYFKEAYGEMGIFTTTRYKSLVFFDVDNLGIKKISGSSEETVRDLVRIAKGIIFEQGQLVRWNEDALLALLEIPAESAKYKFNEICRRSKDELGVTLSVGISDINLSDSIKKNYYRSIIACYAVKEDGGNGVRLYK